MADLSTFLIYENSSKEILGVFRLSSRAASLYPKDPVNQTKIDLTPAHPIIHEQLKWKVNDAGDNVEQKEVVIISVDKPNILADGIDEAAISLSGLVAPALVSFGNGLSQTVTPADPVIQLTSDVPRQFVVEINDMLHFSEPVFVETK